ncbi:hypothetical protein HK407_09g14920 [Ordospora pajunii]|uniref:uncharacterized protein n=1 Tax=Ordospora pajunii TaxID=3039483 RepID=UPI0029527BD4|nr:uncharacterized protein HK407_09g14920 [Ordospora pajunii]KAH9410897.1 hypothetical protein HK407_09g14920 [Ordospora pajunii]
MLFYRVVDGQRVYTLNEEGSCNAHPAKFSVEDRFSRQRISTKVKFQIPPFNSLKLGISSDSIQQ